MKPRTTEKAFPFEGEGGAPATDEGGRTGLTSIPPCRNARLRRVEFRRHLPTGGLSTA